MSRQCITAHWFGMSHVYPYSLIMLYASPSCGCEYRRNIFPIGLEHAERRKGRHSSATLSGLIFSIFAVMIFAYLFTNLISFRYVVEHCSLISTPLLMMCCGFECPGCLCFCTSASLALGCSNCDSNLFPLFGAQWPLLILRKCT